MEFFKLAQAWGFSLPDLLLVAILIQQNRAIKLIQAMLTDHDKRLAIIESRA